MARIVHEPPESGYRRRPCLKVALERDARRWRFEIQPVPKAHAWHAWVERDGPPSLAVYFTLSEALEAKTAYEREIEGCLSEGWRLVAEATP